MREREKSSKRKVCDCEDFEAEEEKTEIPGWENRRKREHIKIVK